MSSAKNPIKISVIDEDAIEEDGVKSPKAGDAKKTSPAEKPKSVQAPKKETKTRKPVKKSPAKKTGAKKTVKKSGKKVPASKQEEPTEDQELEDEKSTDIEVKETEKASGQKSVDSLIMSKKKLVTDAIGEGEEADATEGREGEEINIEESLSRDDFAEKLKKELAIDSQVATTVNAEVNAEQPGEEEKASQEFLNQIQPDQLDGGALTGLSEGEDEEIQEIVKEKNRTNRSVSMYRKIVAFFGLLLVLCAVAVLYFVLVKVTVVIVPDQERMSNNLIFDVYDHESETQNSSNKINGVVRSVELRHEKSYAVSGEEVIGKEAVGKIVLINSYSKNQMLVATTRLLSSDGKLFRLKNTVNVPAGGEIEAEMYADDPSPDMAIGPAKFNIPGLWAGLQDKIYGESKDKVVYQQKIKKYAVQDDIDFALRDMKQQLLVKAKADLAKEYSKYDEIIYNLNDESIVSVVDAKAGDEVNEVVVSMTADVVIIAFEGQEAGKLAEQKFNTSLSSDKELVSFDSENIIYSLNNFNSNEGIATINATFEGKVSLRDTASVVEKNKIVGLNQKQLEAYLANKEGISGYDVKFSPSFLPDFLKRVPRLPERIETEIKK